MALEDYSSDRGQVRLLIGDVDPDDYLLPDEAIDGYLDIAGGTVKLAAADALDAIASSEALLSKKITTQDRSTDGPAVAQALRKHAEALRNRAAEEGEDSFFDVFGIAARPARAEGEEYRL